MKHRFWRLMGGAAGLLVLGLGYALICALFGSAVPCPFHWITGLYCPGCGVTRMCLALLRLDLAAAWHANAALLLLLPVGGVLAAQLAWQYLKTGSRALSRRQGQVVWGMIVVLLAFGVLRNLPLFSYLAPSTPKLI